MKIAWFSPLVPQHSDIANYTGRLMPELRAEHEVRFFSEGPEGFSEPARHHVYPAALGHTPTELLLDLNQIDLPIYNLGNHPGFFARTWFLSQVKPGLVILHDFKLHHFYEGIYREHLEDKPRYLRSLWEHYGRVGHEAGSAYWQQKISIDFMAQHFPMTEWAIRNALALVVHTPHALETLTRLTRTPVQMIPLAYAPQAAERPDPSVADFSADGSFTTERRVRLILFGYLNVNRRIVEFLTALSAMTERDRFEVRLVGTVENRRDVEIAIKMLGLSERVTLHGYVPEAELETALDRADLAINLRFPTMGEASGSQLRIWDHALPSLVTDTEGYATMSPDTVFFVRPSHETADIHTHLRRFLRRPDDFHRAGRCGRRWLLEHHLPSMYVAQLGKILVQAEGLRSRHNQLTLADRVGSASAPWINRVPLTERERFYASGISELV